MTQFEQHDFKVDLKNIEFVDNHIVMYEVTCNEHNCEFNETIEVDIWKTLYNREGYEYMQCKAQCMECGEIKPFEEMSWIRDNSAVCNECDGLYDE